MVYKKVVKVDDIQESSKSRWYTRKKQKQMIYKKVVKVDGIQESSRSR